MKKILMKSIISIGISYIKVTEPLIVLRTTYHHDKKHFPVLRAQLFPDDKSNMVIVV